jgi:site-specific DNA-methyltransferase (adenine-specific)/modification methylase
VTEFSQLRISAGYEIVDVVEQFDAKYPAVARWESGDEVAPPGVVRALREIGRLAPSSAENVRELIKPISSDLASIEDTLFEGDCLKLLERVPAGYVDLILCDLPYGTTQNRWDSVIDLKRLWKEYRRILKPNGVVVLTAQGIFTAKLILSNEDWFKYKIVWEKSKPTNFLNAKKQPLRKHEDVCVFYGKPPTYNPQMRAGAPYDKGVRKNQLSGSYGDFQPAHVRSDGERYPADIVYFKTAESEAERTVWHPTQKPVELGRYLVRTFSNEGDVVLDNAFGSGSFLVAAAMESRRFIGIERNEEVHLFKDEQIDYVALAADRLRRTGVTARVIRTQ